jgi:hypothetical protein
LTWHDYQLEETVLKATADATLWQTDRGLVKISRNTLAVPIRIGDQRKGYVFHGCGKLMIDAIVETGEGAVGRSIDKELNKPFLLLGAKEELGQRFAAVVEEDLKNAGYEHDQQFIAAAQAICDEFFDRRIRSGRRRFGVDKGLVFAFPSDTSKMDILLAEDSKLVYKKAGFAFVSSHGNSILKSRGVVALSRGGRSCVVNR